MNTVLVVLGVIALVAIIYLVIAAVFAFLWNAVLVGALGLAIPTINLWVSLGIIILLGIVGSFFRSTSYRR